MSIFLKDYEARAKEILAGMTPEEKAGLCSGSDFWHTKGVERLGLKGVMVTDGPHGLRKQAGDSDHLGINQSVPATCFPTAATTACSFDPELLRKIGAALGEECLQEEVAVLLGPGANIKRSPLCGRNFEYFSEDPYLTGMMASALIQGVQSKGVGTSIKHYAVNNQETRRMVIDALVDERALREIYLAGYEMAAKQARPWTFMCSYNRINGDYGSQNPRTLTEILRDEWGFEGAVMSDWGAVVDRVKGLEAGLDLEMPHSGPANDEAILAAFREGRLSADVLDLAAKRMLCLLLAAADNAKPGYRYDVAAHRRLARKAAAESSVLLKNEGNLLPLAPGKKLALLGAFAQTPRYQGAGSSRITPINLGNLRDVLAERGAAFTYAAGYDLGKDEPDQALLDEAAAAARDADLALVCIGLPDAYESEGFDREHLRIPESHIALLEQTAAINPNTVALLFCGAAVEMPWAEKVKAILLLYLGGEAGAEGAADLLYGDVNPSGKLAETFPLRLEDVPSSANFPGGEKTVEYRESIYVGYRYYDKAGAETLFPFGYGLSYTSFEYRDLSVVKNGDAFDVSIKVKNTGKKAGAEAVQFYLSQKSPSVFRPLRELKGFAKLYLEPGEEKIAAVTLDRRAFAWYNPEKKDWTVEAGEYTVAAAASSRDIRAEAALTLEGETVKTAAPPGEYLKPGVPLVISKEAFESLYGRALPPSSRLPGEPLTANSTRAEFAKTQTGAGVLAGMRQGMGSAGVGADGGGDESFGRMFERMFAEMPLRSLAMFSQGALGPEQVTKMLEAANAELAGSR
jgi:beta-glucosidase